MGDDRKVMADFEVVENCPIHELYCLMTLRPMEHGDVISRIRPGQFVQIAIEGSRSTYLRRPISINDVDDKTGTITLLVRKAGNGTARLLRLHKGCVVNLLLPLGNGFILPSDFETTGRVLLVGGGVGVAPLLYWGKTLAAKGVEVATLIGARSVGDLLLRDRFAEFGPVYVSTDDGSCGEPGLVTENSALAGNFDVIYCCGPAPMMKAVAQVARYKGVASYVSLENMMACGVGACLCCVEKTVRGNVCVCTEGPVFDINDLTW